MPHKRDIEAAVAAHNATDDRKMPLLPPEAARLLAAMFRRSDVCQCSLSDLVAEGIDERTVRALLRTLSFAGFLSKEPTRRRGPLMGPYKLHLPAAEAPKSGPRMSTDRPRRDDIAAAVAAYDQANPLTPLPHNAERLLSATFPTDDIYRGNLEDITALGFSRRHLPGTLQRLINAGFLPWEKGRPSTYWLHLPPVRP